MNTTEQLYKKLKHHKKIYVDAPQVKIGKNYKYNLKFSTKDKNGSNPLGEKIANNNQARHFIGRLRASGVVVIDQFKKYAQGTKSKRFAQNIIYGKSIRT